MHFWIVQTGEPVFTDGPNVRPMRAMNLASMAISKGHKVTLITSNFDHFSKRKRFAGDKFEEISENLGIQFVDSPGYKRNISFKRFFDHYLMGKRMLRISSKLEKPDAVFIGYPPIETSWFLAKYCVRKGIPYILDVKDAWPSNIVEAFPYKVRPIIKWSLTPYFRMFSFTARNALKVCSITSEFLNWTQVTSKRGFNSSDFIAYLSSRNVINSESDLSAAEKWFESKINLNNDLPTIYFIGSLSRSFDFGVVLEAAKSNTFNLVIGGHGEQLTFLSDRVKTLPNVHLVGWVDSAQSEIIALNSNYALAPMRPLSDFEMSIPNKYFDYLRRGTPILSSLNGPSRTLLESEKVGIYYESSDDILSIVNNYISNPADTKLMASRCSEVFTQIFSYEKVYSQLVNELVEIAKPN